MTAAAGHTPDSGYGSIATYLTSMIGDYRDIKQSPEASDLNSMVKEYNNAVESANRIDDRGGSDKGNDDARGRQG